jgi:maltose/moltooligosaccharide transporter
VSIKKKMSLLQIMAMSVGFFGIQHGFSIQFAKMSVIYEKLGASPDQIPFLWLAAPLTGLFIQPIIGYLSDRTWGPLGRRRPYFLTGAILATVALLFMPNASSLWMAAGLLWMLDASINVSMEPFRAFVADKLPTEQISTGYAMQTFMIGIGGSLGFIIASTDWMHQYPALKGIAPSSLHLQFYICAAIYLVAVLFTVISTPEDPPEDLHLEQSNPSDGGISVQSWAKETWHCLKGMPEPMKRLAGVQFFTWMGLFCMWIFYSVAVAHHVFGATDPHSALYDKGVAAAGNSMSVYQLVSTFFALCIPMLASKFSRVTIHTIGLIAAGLGLLSIWFIKDPALLLFPMIGVGIGWATILSMPYALLVDYIPKARYGIYMGLFNMFIVIPEILSSLGLGWVMQHVFHNNHMLAIAMGGGFLLIAAILVQSLKQFDQKKPLDDDALDNALDSSSALPA